MLLEINAVNNSGHSMNKLHLDVHKLQAPKQWKNGKTLMTPGDRYSLSRSWNTEKLIKKNPLNN